MAVYPYFVLGPKTLVSIAGYLKGPDRTIPTPNALAATAVVDVVIPALNEERNIGLCLASVARQTRRPRNVILVDDGSSDRTVRFAEAFGRANGLEILVIRRKAPIGKTPTLKRQSREFDCDVEFVLDADTYLESDDYIERVVEELFLGAGIWSACGTILPMRARDRERQEEDPAVRRFFEAEPEAARLNRDRGWSRVWRGISNAYREVLYSVLQRFVYPGEMRFFGSIVNPLGCAVAYRREYLRGIFDRYEPLLGDDLTTSEDIFLGFAGLHRGYRNVHLQDVVARTLEPELPRLPRQVHVWSSSFLQSCYYFDLLLRSPFRWASRRRHRRRSEHLEKVLERRKVTEPYREPWGEEVTRQYGRPMGWAIAAAALEKLFFPAALLIMVLLGWWEVLAVTVAAEVALATGFLVASAPAGERLWLAVKGVLTTPVRYGVLLGELVTMVRFAIDIWFRHERQWRK